VAVGYSAARLVLNRFLAEVRDVTVQVGRCGSRRSGRFARLWL